MLADLPMWLVKWTALICEYIEYEHDKYPVICHEEELSDEGQSGPKLGPQKVLTSEADLRIDAKVIKESKIQNVAITLNKVQHVLA